jgi:tRNA modification GTPase
MFSTADTIVAIATPPGRGGIGIVRLSGPEAESIACGLIGHTTRLTARYATFATVHVQSSSVPSGRSPIDQVLVTYFPGPRSYTGENVVEISAHGSPVVLRTIVEAAMASGARFAEPGEFTLRAFLNGRVDLMQAEAVADLIDAVTPLQARAACDQLNGTLTNTVSEIHASLFDLIAGLEASVDFPEEGYHFVDPRMLAAALDEVLGRLSRLVAEGRRGRLVREGLQIAIVGAPNVGKSSLFNALLGAARAIVTPVAGTTRDLVTETLDLDGLQVTLVDTAGVRDADDLVEAEGVRRSHAASAVADLVVAVFDRSRPREEQELRLSLADRATPVVQIANKADLPARWADPGMLDVSARTGAGIAELRERLVHALDLEPRADRPAMTNVRHLALVERARDAVVRARGAALSEGGSLSEEFVLADLQDARHALEEISGRRTADDVLAAIFSRFCIGK